MGKLSIDLNSLKAAGVYTMEYDNSQRSVNENINSLRMVVGFANKGPFNRPVLLNLDSDRTATFGEIDTKMEYKGCYFNRALRTSLTNGPVIALNLLKVNTDINGPDQVNFAALSLDAGTKNPVVIDDKTDKYGQYDYLAETVDNVLYGTTKGSNIPYVGCTPFANVYNRSRFWVPDKDLLTASAAMHLIGEDPGTYENANLLNFANVGTEEFSILVFKLGNVAGYDVTAETWYGGIDNIPYGWIRPYDYISDYFIQVICIKGNWSNYAVLSTDPVWGAFFDKKGIIKNKITGFLRTEGIKCLGNWSGCIIPDFVDKQGTNIAIEKKINALTEQTGLLMSFNNDLANVLRYDYTGKDSTEEDPYKGCWGLDIDDSGEISGEESEAKYIVDMCGHNAFTEKEMPEYEYVYQTFIADISADSSIYNSKRDRVSKSPAYVNISCIFPLEIASDTSMAKVIGDSSLDVIKEVPCGTYIDSSIMNTFDPEIDTSILNANVLAGLVSDKYYVLSNLGTMSGAKHGTVKSVVYSRSGNNTLDVSVDMIYGTEERRVSFSVDVSTYGKIEYIIALHDDCEMYRKQAVEGGEEVVKGITFMSYNYIKDDETEDGVLKAITNVAYYSDPTLWDVSDGQPYMPVDRNNKNMFIITAKDQWDDANIKVGDFVKNITYNNEVGETAQYKLIPGLARIIKKQFMQISNGNIITVNGTPYPYNGGAATAKNGNYGFYLLTATAPVLIKDGEIERQLPISDDRISHSLRFMPMRGLTITSRHRPGYKEDGTLDIEAGIKKIYGVLSEDEGIRRGLMNKAMVNYRYVIDSMSYGLDMELGGKVELSKVAYDRGKTTAVLNLPSAKQFAVSSNPYFCDTFTPGSDVRKPLNTKYIPEGGNTEMGATIVFTLPEVEHGASFTACFWPNLIYTENGQNISVPPAADACNVLNRKFTGTNNPYCICANQNGIINNKYVTGLEFYADITDREYLEPFGVNTIIKEDGNYMIYGNQTAYQSVKSDLNKLHVRENLNTAEIECEKITSKYNFLYNTPATRANLVQLLTAPLQVMKNAGALANFEIICDETNNTDDVILADSCVVEIGLWFNHGMEKIIQVFTINKYSSSNE